MNIQEIYEKYKIMPQLQLHQLRVAAVASIIADNFEAELDNNSITTACLLHDMGNIIKFDLQKFPRFLEPKGLEYWQKVKIYFEEKYGPDEHKATFEIVKKLQVSRNVREIIAAYGFSKAVQTHKTTDYNIKIAAYSDHRVNPLGICSLNERIKDGEKRYENNPKYKGKFQTLAPVWKKIEKQIFAKCKIAPIDINEKSVRPLIDKLRKYKIQTK